MKIRAAGPLLLFLFLLFPAIAAGAAGLYLELPSAAVAQGSLVSGILKVDQASLAAVDPQKLRGQTLGDVVYVHQVGPLVRRVGGRVYEAEAKVIFVKVPAAASVPVPGGTLSWGTLEVRPTDAPQELLFGTFTVPARRKLLLWVAILAGLVVLGIISRRVWKKLELRRRERLRRRRLKEALLSAADFAAVVELWRAKHAYLGEFPHIADPLRELEAVLFKYQFKPTQTDAERAEVLAAYRTFTAAVAGGFDGI